jgi:hypothetical protein
MGMLRGVCGYLCKGVEWTLRVQVQYLFICVNNVICSIAFEYEMTIELGWSVPSLRTLLERSYSMYHFR